MLNYSRTGNENSSETLVFVHGSGCNHKVFHELSKYLNAYDCILLDLNGHGNSSGECSQAVQGYINNVIDFIQNNEVTKDKKNITVIGYSMGGGIVLGVALQKLCNVKKVVVLSGGAKFDKLDKVFMGKIHKNIVDKMYLLRCLGNYLNPLTYKNIFNLEKDKKVMINDLTACEKFDISNAIKGIDIPVKIIVARDEILTLLEYSEFIHKEIKSSQLKVFEKGRHFLIVVKAKEVAEEINKFICSNI